MDSRENQKSHCTRYNFVETETAVSALVDTHPGQATRCLTVVERRGRTYSLTHSLRQVSVLNSPTHAAVGGFGPHSWNRCSWRSVVERYFSHAAGSLCYAGRNEDMQQP